jgi:hypothetical protein
MQFLVHKEYQELITTPTNLLLINLPGLDHFDDFRFFHFFEAPVIDSEGNVHSVGVFQCKARVADTAWHDTKGNRSSYIPLFKGWLR